MEVRDPPKEIEYMRSVENIKTLWVRSESNHWTGRRATRRFRRARKGRSWDECHQSTTEHPLPHPQAPPSLQGIGVGGCRDPGKPKSRVTTPWISVSFLEQRRRALIQRHRTGTWIWHWPHSKRLSSDPWSLPNNPGKPLSSLNLHKLHWQFRVLTNLLSALCSRLKQAPFL